MNTSLYGRRVSGKGYTNKGYTCTLPPPPPPAKRIRTRESAWLAMLSREVVTVGDYTGLINSIGMEDGSGHSFIIEMSVNNITHKMYVRLA